MERKFNYNGFTFIPLRKSSLKFAELARRISSDRELGFSKYQWRKLPWSYDDFYKASGDSESDLFKCLENGNVYIPGNNELFLFT